MSHRLVSLMGILLLFNAVLGRAQPGTILYESTFPDDIGGFGSWAYDPVFERFYDVDGPRVRKIAKTGEVIVEYSAGDLPNEIESTFRNSFFRGFWVENDEIFYGLNNNILNVWTVGEDNEGKITATLDDSFDFSVVLTGGFRDIARAPDGTYWVLTSDDKVKQLSADGSTTIREFLEDEMLETFHGDGFLGTQFIEVDQFSGNLFLNIGSLDPGAYTYLWDPETKRHLGRYSQELNLSQYAGGYKSLITFGTVQIQEPVFDLIDTVREISLEEQNLPTFTSFETNIKGVFWTGCYDNTASVIEPQIQLDVQVDWAGSPGFVFEQFHDEELTFYVLKDAPIDGSTISSTYEMPFPFSKSPEPTVLFNLVNGEGQMGPPQFLDLQGGQYDLGVPISPITGLSSSPSNCELWTVSVNGSTVVWRAKGVFPEQPFDARVDVPAIVPFIGGNDLGLRELQASADGKLVSEGRGHYAIGGGGEFRAGSGKIRIELGGGATTELKHEALEFPSGFIFLNAAGIIDEEVGITELFPQLAVFKQAPLIGHVFNWLDDRAKIIGALSVGMNTKAEVSVDEEGEFVFSSEIAGLLGVSLQAQVDIPGGLAEVSAGGGGESQVVFIPNDRALELKEITLTLTAFSETRISLSVLRADRTFQIKYTPDQGFQVFPSSGRDGSQKVEWLYLYGDHEKSKVRSESIPTPHLLTKNPYSALDEVENRKRGVISDPVKNTEVGLVGGVPRDGNPHVACAPDGSMMVVWSQPVPDRPATQATDIYYTLFSNGKIVPPEPISVDTHADQEAKVAWHHSGVWIALWLRVKNPNLQPTGDPEEDAEQQMLNMGAAYSIYDPDTGIWTPPTFFQNEGQMAFSPKISTGPDHTISCFWLESDDGRILPIDYTSDPNVPSRQDGISAAWSRYTHGSFEPAKRHGSVYDNIVDYDVAETSDTGYLLMLLTNSVSRPGGEGPMGGKFFVETTRRIFASQDSYFTLESQDELGVGTIFSFGPKLALGNSGETYAAWNQLKDNQLGMVYTDDLTVLGKNDTELLVREPLGPLGRRDYLGSRYDQAKMGVDGEGRPFVIYKGFDEGEPNLQFVVLDESGVSSSQSPITLDSTIERDASVEQDPDGNPLIAYFKGGFEKTPGVGNFNGETASFTMSVPEEFGTISLTRRRLFTDLKVGKVELRGGLAGEDNTLFIDVELTNYGDLSVENPEVSVYAIPEGASRGSELISIGENVVAYSGRMPGSSSKVVQLEWVMPDDRNYEFLAVADPMNKVQEESEENNSVLNEDPFEQGSLVLEKLLGRSLSEADQDFNQDGATDIADHVTEQE